MRAPQAAGRLLGGPGALPGCRAHRAAALAPPPPASAAAAAAPPVGGAGARRPAAALLRRGRRRPRAVAASSAADAAESTSGSDLDADAGGAAAAPAAPAAGGGGKLSGLARRAVSGALLGAAGLAVVAAGGWAFNAVTCLASWRLSREYETLINAKGMTKGMKPPPPAVSAATSAACVALNVWAAAHHGRAASAMAVATFLVLSLQLLVAERPRFAQLASSAFGLLYCGYLPSFWIRLRAVSVPAVHSTALHGWPAAAGGLPHVTAGLVATAVVAAAIVAADTGAFFTGRALGRTQLSSVSPKKTVEGAAGGLACAVAVAYAAHAGLAWPATAGGAVLLGAVVFLAALFGDLIESVIKRDAGLKDAGDLIPGHGGLLDRLDSYLFTGACAYFFLRRALPGFGV